MTRETTPEPADSLLAELHPLIQATPHTCRNDLWTALALAISVHRDTLQSSSGRLGDRDADLQQVGHAWAAARHPLDLLLDLLGTVNEKMIEQGGEPRETDVTATGTGIIQAVLAGFEQAYCLVVREDIAPHSLRQRATALLWDLAVPLPRRPPLAESYAVIAMRRVGPSSGKAEETKLLEHCDRAGAVGTLPFLAEPVSYLLVPASYQRHAVELAGKLYQELPGQAWLAVAWRRREEVVSGRQEARDIARIVAASERPPGVYRVDDVPVEYAVLREASVAGQLTGIVAPLTNLPILLVTLKSLIAANGNRSKAAGTLGVHRKTLDYRLQRIEQLTGRNPATAEGLQLLTVALTTCAAEQFGVPEQAQPG